MSSLTKRQCGDCTVCCEGWLTGSAHGKPFYPGRPCHFIGAQSCSIYNDRPEMCVKFTCLWLEQPDVFPEWLKPNHSKVLAYKQKTPNGHLYYRIHECGQKIDSKILNYLVQWSLNSSVNISVQVHGGWSNYGKPEFLAEVSLGKRKPGNGFPKPAE
jgi:hypothetical protein